MLAEYESSVNSVYQLDKQYVDLLERLFSDCPSISAATISQTDFYKKSMIAIFNKYNLCHDPGLASTTFRAKEKITVIGTIYGAYALRVENGIQPISGLILGLFFNFIHPRVNERLALSWGINYKNFKYSGFNATDNYRQTYNTNLVGFPIKATYFFSSVKKRPSSILV